MGVNEIVYIFKYEKYETDFQWTKYNRHILPGWCTKW